MKVQISPHALLRAKERGTNPSEIEQVLSTGMLVPARHGRRCTTKLFSVDEVWQGKRYSQKMVEVYYVVEGDAIVVVTVYAFFGTWKS